MDSNATLPNITVAGDDNVTGSVNGTKIPATPEGMTIAYLSLFMMAIVPIVIGSLRSLKFHKSQLDSGTAVEEKMSHRDAAMFPVFASIALFTLFVIFKLFSKEYVNLLLTIYFSVLGVGSVSYLLAAFASNLVPSSFPNMDYHVKFSLGSGAKNNQTPVADTEFSFDRKDLVFCAIGTALGVWYIATRHWVANNIFGLAFSVNGIEMIQLNQVTIGCLLLGGLFVYDVFWVFGTNVMVTVAKSFDGPIKLVFPQDLLEHGLWAKNFAMLGLGDIVLPGVFIALLLRYDNKRKFGSRCYFYTSFVAYCLGLGLTIFVMHYFKHAQPALLYLVPLVLGCPLFLALLKGDLPSMLGYKDHEETGDKQKKSTGESDGGASETESEGGGKGDNLVTSSGGAGDASSGEGSPRPTNIDPPVSTRSSTRQRTAAAAMAGHSGQ